MSAASSWRRREAARRTVKADDAILIDVGLVDKILELGVAGVEAELLHDVAKFSGRDVA